MEFAELFSLANEKITDRIEEPTVKKYEYNPGVS